MKKKDKKHDEDSAHVQGFLLMSPKRAWGLLSLLVVTLLVGTLMPDALRNELQRASHSPFALSSWAHFVVFTAMALVMRNRPLCLKVWQILLVALLLALLSEGLQFLTPDRHPRWIDVGIDMGGTLLGLALASGLPVVFARRKRD